jgi:hypothetical protein
MLIPAKFQLFKARKVVAIPFDLHQREGGNYAI